MTVYSQLKELPLYPKNTLPSLMLREHFEEGAVVIGARGWKELLQDRVVVHVNLR